MVFIGQEQHRVRSPLGDMGQEGNWTSEKVVEAIHYLIQQVQDGVRRAWV